MVSETKDSLRRVSLPAFAVALLFSAAVGEVAAPSAPTSETVQVNISVQGIPSEPPPPYAEINPFPRGREVVPTLGNVSFQQMQNSLAKVKMSKGLRTFLTDRAPELTWVGVKNSASDEGDISKLARLGLKFFKNTHLFFKKEDTTLVLRDIKPHLRIWRRLKLEKAAFSKQKRQSLQIKRTYRSTLTGRLKQRGQVGLPITLGQLRQGIGSFSWLQGTRDDTTIANFLRDKNSVAHHRTCAKTLLKHSDVRLDFDGLCSANGEAVSLAIQKVQYRQNIVFRFFRLHGKTYKDTKAAMKVNRRRDLQANEEAFQLLLSGFFGQIWLRLTASAA